MTDVVARLRQLEAAATPGPWKWEHDDHGAPRVPVIEVQGSGTFSPPFHVRDAPFIAAARNALPQLLAIAEAAIEAKPLIWQLANPSHRADDDAAAELQDHVALIAQFALNLLEPALAALDSQETE